MVHLFDGRHAHREAFRLGRAGGGQLGGVERTHLVRIGARVGARVGVGVSGQWSGLGLG